MCGGRGSRLWPLSTDNKPKQFLKIINNHTLLQNTIDRIPKDYLKVFVSNINFKADLDKYIKNDDIVIYEPVSRNTGQAIYIACLYLKNKFKKNFKIIALPCDHLFDDDKFCTLLNRGMELLKKQKNIITFGIKPTYPETGFGYILKDKNNKILKFIEKPSLEKANSLIEQGCLWNCGVFLFKLNNIIDLYEIYNQKNNNYCNDSLYKGEIQNNCIILGRDYYNTENISFDYLIMEKIDNGLILEYNSLWSDIGDWKRLRDNFITNNENKTIGNNIENINTEGSLIYSDKGKVVTIGIKDLVVVKYGDNLLIIHKDSSDDFKRYIQK